MQRLEVRRFGLGFGSQVLEGNRLGAARSQGCLIWAAGFGWGFGANLGRQWLIKAQILNRFYFDHDDFYLDHGGLLQWLDVRRFGSQALGGNGLGAARFQVCRILPAGGAWARI